MILTEVERACGVTESAVMVARARGAVVRHMFLAPANTPPAVAGAAARLALGGPAEFSHINTATGYPVYVMADRHRVDYDGNRLELDPTCARCEFNEYPHEH